MSNKDREYREFKQYLQSLNLTSAEYERRLRKWCRENNY
jgi:hypothetical protein